MMRYGLPMDTSPLTAQRLRIQVDGLSLAVEVAGIGLRPRSRLATVLQATLSRGGEQAPADHHACLLMRARLRALDLRLVDPPLRFPCLCAPLGAFED